ACCIDSSPNGSLQDLASDSSITSQDTIILINQNKAFHLESVNHAGGGSENIYENLQSAPDYGLINAVMSAQSAANENSKSNDSTASSATSQTEAATTATSSSESNDNSSELLYANTSELLSS